MIINTGYKGIEIDTDTLKNIYVFMDREYLHIGGQEALLFLPHDSVEKNIVAGGGPILTHCADFFDFDTLLMGYDVSVIRGDTWIVLSQLLLNDDRWRYSAREIRWKDNARNMLMGGFLQFLPTPGIIVDILKEEVALVERSRTIRTS
jgi:hypothetical protein